MANCWICFLLMDLIKNQQTCYHEELGEEHQGLWQERQEKKRVGQIGSGELVIDLN